MDRADATTCTVGSVPRIAYVAYPSSLILRSANAIQTYATVEALRSSAPDFEALIPRFAFRPSLFSCLGATHLLRLPFNAGRHLIRSFLWSYLERTWFSFRVCVYVVAKSRLRRPEVIYVRDIVCAMWLSFLLPRLLRIPVIFEMHDREATNPSANSGMVTRWVARHIDRFAVRNASGIVSLTDAFIPELSTLIGRAEHPPIRVIPDAYDDRVYRPGERARARGTIGIPPHAFVIVYTGLTFAYHGVELLVDAFAIVRESVPTATLLLVGGRDGERATIADRAARHGIADYVRVVPPQAVHEIPVYLAAADVLVIPDTVTKTSASPLKLFEYAAMARPIVATDLAALREILPADAARYVAPSDPTAAAAGIIWVATHPAEAGAMADRARTAVQCYTYRNRAAAIITFCQSVREPAHA